MILFLLGLVLAYLSICYVLAYNYIHPTRRIVSLPPELIEAKVPGRFGDVPAWLTPSLNRHPSQKPIFLLAHGYGGCRASWVDLMNGLNQRGFDSIALAMPGQDENPIDHVGFGVLESEVICDSVHWLRSAYPNRKVIVLGVSMGGGAAWLATQEDPSIDGVVTDCAFAKFDEPMKAFFDRKVPGGSVFFGPVVWIAEQLSGVDPYSIRPVDAARAWRGKPAIVIQGDADTLVVPSHAVRLSEAAGCPMWLVPGAGHAESFAADPKKYLDHLVDFAANVEVNSKPIEVKS